MNTETSSSFPRFHFDAKCLETARKTSNYPYGGMTCTMFFFVEDGGKKGWRAVTQSINPKTGCLNKPKKGTYCHSPIFIAETKEGFFEFVHAPLHLSKDGKNVNDFIAKYWNVIPESMRKYCALDWKLQIIRSPEYYKDTMVNTELPLTKSEKAAKQAESLKE
jgi:hypothetical protein